MQYSAPSYEYIYHILCNCIKVISSSNVCLDLYVSSNAAVRGVVLYHNDLSMQ